jgi:hypothetical protein
MSSLGLLFTGDRCSKGGGTGVAGIACELGRDKLSDTLNGDTGILSSGQSRIEAGAENGLSGHNEYVDR